MRVGAPAGEHVVDGVDRAAAALGDRRARAGDHPVDRLERDVLEHRDRVDAVVGAVEPAPGGNWSRTKSQVGVGGGELRVLARAVAAAVVGIDDRHLVAEPREQPGDQRLAGADLDQPRAALDVAEHRLDRPAALEVLHVGGGGGETGHVLGRVGVVAHGPVGDRLELEAAP